jgi:hypothetical protein
VGYARDNAGVNLVAEDRDCGSFRLLIATTALGHISIT